MITARTRRWSSSASGSFTLVVRRVGRQADVEAGEVVGELLRGPRAEDRDDPAPGAQPGQPPRIAAEVSSADEKFEIVSSGAAITLLAEGNAGIYSRPGIVCIPVSGLEPARLAVAWRRGDRRPPVRNFVQACRDAAEPQQPNLQATHSD